MFFWFVCLFQRKQDLTFHMNQQTIYMKGQDLFSLKKNEKKNVVLLQL